MKKCLTLIATIIGSLFLCPTAQAGKIKLVLTSKSGGKPDVVAGALVIVNSATGAVSFGLSLDGKEWQKFNLKAGEVREARGENDQIEKLFIKIWTAGSEPKKYSLDVGKRYEIYWNNDKKLWDVGLLTEK
jgi:hypothetical protein